MKISYTYKLKNIFLCFFPLFLLFVSFTQAEAIPGKKNYVEQYWPSEQSDLKPDPSLLRGILANGFRYVIKKNREPAGRVALYLDVQAGSLHETEKQRGVAHFLEHLMFNGSNNFPPGSLVDYFQSVGMSFGSDTNAHTTYNETVYRIFLPKGSPQDVDKGLLVMADYARGALLLESEIDRERGIILAEKRTRDSASYRTHVASTAFAFKGTNYPVRMPIGTQEVLENADQSLLRSYYDSWYRPDNMILVVVGDIDPQEVEDLLSKRFSELVAAGESPIYPDFGSLENNGIETFYHYEPDLGKTHVSIETFWDMVQEHDSIALERKELIRYMGAMIVRYRLQRLLEDDDQPFVQATYHSGDIINRIGYGSISAQTNNKGWQESLVILDSTLRQAITFGFEEIELERVKKEVKSSLDSKVLTAKTEDSRNIARKIINHLNSNRVYQSPVQEKELYGSIVEAITLEDLNRAFQQVWKHDHRLISVTGNSQLGAAGKTKIMSAYRKSQNQKVIKVSGPVKEDFPYLAVAEPTDLTLKSEKFEDIDVERVVFKNGLVVNLKKTPFEENSFQMIAGFGNGARNETIPGMVLLAERVINGSGSGRLSLSDIEAIVAGSSVDMHFKIGESVNYWVGSGLYKDFDLFVQVLYTLMFDSGLRESVFDTVMANVKLMYQKFDREIDGAIPLAVRPFLAEYNPRFGLPDWEKISKITYSELALWVSSIIKIDNLEISLVGDFDRDEVIAKLGNYFGALKLTDFEEVNVTDVNFPSGKSLAVPVNTSIEKSLVALAWPTDDFWDINRTRRLNLLSSVFEDRVRKVVREKLGATYSPSVSSSNSRVYKGYGFMIAQMTVKPSTEDQVLDEIMLISNQLSNKGINAEELERAKRPIVTSLKDRVKTNNYWLYSVLFLSSRYPQQLEWPKTLLSDYSSITEKELSMLAGKYFHDSKIARITVLPGSNGRGEDLQSN